MNPAVTSPRHFRPQQHLENVGPRKVRLVARLHVFSDADQRRLQSALAARVQHLLLNGGDVGAPATTQYGLGRGVT